jgi:uncharacterized protein
MASGLLMLLDDIATMLDDIAILTKVAAKKTAGVLGDDLALNAQQVSGVDASRELPVVFAVAKGSFVNKCILVPCALMLSAVAPWAITPLLIIGGLFLCFEGVEKIVHRFLHKAEADAHDHELELAVADPQVDLVAVEKEKISGAIRTDFILSAEIVVISLGLVEKETLLTQSLVLATMSVLMTVGVYGLVAMIVKIDDLGLKLLGSYDGVSKMSGKQRLGSGLIKMSPYLMKFLSIAGTVAMFLVGGGIVVHKVEPLHHLMEGITKPLGPIVGWVVENGFNAGVGIIGGAICVLVWTLIQRLIPKKIVDNTAMPPSSGSQA